MTKPSILRQLVAHRGESAIYPENTLLSMRQALEAGALYLECDVHLSEDLVPMVIHDSRMGRTTAVDSGRVWNYTAEQLTLIPAGYRERFGSKFEKETIPTLSSLVQLVGQWPEATLFVELKRASLQQFGEQTVLSSVLSCLEQIKGQYTIISYNQHVLKLAQNIYRQPVAWVSDEVNDEVLQQCDALSPEYLITDADNFDKSFLSIKHDWRWMLFEVNDIKLAQEWINAGVALVETNCINHFIASE